MIFACLLMLNDQPGEGDISSRLGDRDKRQENRQSFAHHAGRKGQRVADKRHPAQQ